MKKYNSTNLVESYAELISHNVKKENHWGLPIPKKILFFSPHPDDESITSALALRLKNEHNCIVKNVCMTLGSKVERQNLRSQELSNACFLLGFENMILRDLTAESITKCIQDEKPDIIFLPHKNDGHPIHQKCSTLLWNTINQLPKPHFLAIETEYWFNMSNPNLLVESSIETTSQLVEALSCHAGEIERAPYHKQLPAWMIDNTRRGIELVQKFGSSNLNIIFSTLYNVHKFRRDKWESIQIDHPLLLADENLESLLAIIE